MPCYDTRDASDRANVAEAARAATRAACDMLQALRDDSGRHCLTEETLAWVSKHDAEDAERLKRERIQKD